MLYIFAADALLFLHVLIVIFVVSGLILMWIGKRLKWSWVRNPVFRWSHLLCVAVIVAQSWMGKLCPLTIWEMALREKGDDATYAGSFVSYWLEELLYIDAPMWAFAVLYTSFGLLVVAGWIWIRPRSFRSVRPSSHGHTEGE